mmetsp:Transcript_83485/g.249034  ORF Transcript_83485/g.249034 Transcript_83485/m.249034 type:complete len:249 (-) Transcript_83485:186-932(-)
MGPLPRAPQWQLVGGATKLQWVLCGAVIVHTVEIRHWLAEGYVHDAPVHATPVAGPCMEGRLGRQVIDILQQVHLATFRPRIARSVRPECRPESTTPGSMRELDGHEEICPGPVRPDLRGLALEHPRASAAGPKYGVRVVGLDNPVLQGFGAGQVVHRAIVVITLQEGPVVEEGLAHGPPIESVGLIRMLGAMVHWRPRPRRMGRCGPGGCGACGSLRGDQGLWCDGRVWRRSSCRWCARRWCGSWQY